MMTAQEFKNKAIATSLKGVDKEPKDWITFNDQMHTKLITDDNDFKSKVHLNSNESPILECDMSTSYLLVTTDRIISIINNFAYEGNIELIDDITDDYAVKNSTKGPDGRYPKISLFSLLKKNGDKILFAVDSYYPAGFTMILISNLISYKSTGEWFLNIQ